MSDSSPQIRVEVMRNLRRVVDLLDLSESQLRPGARDRAWLHGARAKIQIACNLLDESPTADGTLVSVRELILKAEISLASMDLRLNDLSMRIADSLLLETRVRIENLTGA